MLLAGISAVGFGTLAIFMKFAYAAGANTTTILAWRFSIAALLFWAIIRVKGIRLELERRHLLKLLALGGIGYGAMSSLFAATVNVLPASLAGMLLYTYPAQVSILSVLIGDEAFHWRKGGALAVCFMGLALVLDASFAQVSAAGFALGLAAAAVYSVYIVIGNRLLKNADTLVTTTLVCTAAAGMFILFGLASGQLTYKLPLMGWAAIAGMALLATVVAILCFFAGMRLVGASNASIISTIEPVVTVLLAAALLGESITAIQMAGGMLILVGVAALQYSDKTSN